MMFFPEHRLLDVADRQEMLIEELMDRVKFLEHRLADVENDLVELKRYREERVNQGYLTASDVEIAVQRNATINQALEIASSFNSITSKLPTKFPHEQQDYLGEYLS